MIFFFCTFSFCDFYFVFFWLFLHSIRPSDDWCIVGSFTDPAHLLLRFRALSVIFVDVVRQAFCILLILCQF